MKCFPTVRKTEKEKESEVTLKKKTYFRIKKPILEFRLLF